MPEQFGHARRAQWAPLTVRSKYHSPMRPSTTDANYSYDMHRQLEQDPARYDRMPSSIVDPKSIDAWRHDRMRSAFLPFIAEWPGAKWLTIGDGRFGADAHYLLSHGADATASSLTDHTLRQSHEQGHIAEFASVNAEAIDYDDGAFDFVVCKEAYHHLPRPPIGFYEMLRVANEAVIMIEPIDHRNGGVLLKLKGLVKKVLRGDGIAEFEPDGNYLYRVRPAEIGKLLAALNYTTYAYRPFNDFYVGGLANKKASKWSLAMRCTQLGILVQNALCRSGLLGYGLASIVAFKREPSPEALAALRDADFAIRDLPRNPYLTTADEPEADS